MSPTRDAWNPLRAKTCTAASRICRRRSACRSARATTVEVYGRPRRNGAGRASRPTRFRWENSAAAEQRAGSNLDVALEQHAAGSVAVTEHDAERVRAAGLAQVLDLD